MKSEYKTKSKFKIKYINNFNSIKIILKHWFWALTRDWSCAISSDVCKY